MRFFRDLRPAAFAAAPWTAALLTLAAGVMLLASGATPSEPVRFMRLIQITPVYLIETAHFLSSILGLARVLLSFGLRARLDAAWIATLVTRSCSARRWPCSRASTGKRPPPWWRWLC